MVARPCVHRDGDATVDGDSFRLEHYSSAFNRDYHYSTIPDFNAISGWFYYVDPETHETINLHNYFTDEVRENPSKQVKSGN